MLESKLIKYLADNTAYPVSNETPRHKPREYILVQRTSGGMTDLIKSARYAVQSISAVSKMHAAQMNEVVKAGLEPAVFLLVSIVYFIYFGKDTLKN